MLDGLRNFMFGYDAVEDRKRRKSPSSTMKSEDAVLKRDQRRKLSNSNKDINRNFAIASWAIRKHLDYVCSFTFKARTGDEGLNRDLEELVEWWHRKENFDIAARHPMHRFLRICEICRTLDGDMLVSKLTRTGKVQGIQGDRIFTPRGDISQKKKGTRVVHGALINKPGRSLGYFIHNRKEKGTGFEPDYQYLPAHKVIHHGYFDGFDQTRGISPLSSAVATYQDIYENFDYSLAKMKVAQMFGLAIYRDAIDPLDRPDEDDEEEEVDPEDKRDGYDVDFGKGPIFLDLEPGDRAEFLENKTPSNETREFSEVMIAVALKSLDIPYSFYDEGHTNYSGSRQGMLLYNQSATEKRKDNATLLDHLHAWRFRIFHADDYLRLPSRMTLADLKWEFIHKGLPWLDPAKEQKAHSGAIKDRLMSRQQICKMNGRDFYKVVDELAEEESYIKKKGLESVKL